MIFVVIQHHVYLLTGPTISFQILSFGHARFYQEYQHSGKRLLLKCTDASSIRDDNYPYSTN